MADGHTKIGVPASAIQRISNKGDPAEALGIFQRDGVLVIENALDSSLLEEIRTHLDPWFNAAYHGAGQFFGRNTRRFGGLFAKTRSTAHLAIHPEVLPLMETFLKGDPSAPTCDCIELNLTQGIGIEPGEPAQFLHRDEELWPFPHKFELMANAMWALDDFTVENGATRLVPGSHAWPRDRQPEPGDAVSAVAPAGSVILWTGGVLHGGGANVSTSIRRGLVFSYRLGWLASGEKLLLSTPLEIARSLPERLQRLLGYQIHRPNLGWVEGQDPLRWLNKKIGELAPVEDNLAPIHEELLSDATANPQKYAGYLT